MIVPLLFHQCVMKNRWIAKIKKLRAMGLEIFRLIIWNSKANSERCIMGLFLKKRVEMPDKIILRNTEFVLCKYESSCWKYKEFQRRERFDFNNISWLWIFRRGMRWGYIFFVIDNLVLLVWVIEQNFLGRNNYVKPLNIIWRIKDENMLFIKEKSG